MIEINQDKAIEIRKTLLQEFHNMCAQHNLKYSLSFGTMLGAVRHGGMIPWDDDIDLCMPRDDYEKLCNIYADTNCKDRYQFISNHTHPEIKTKIGYFIDYTTVTETAGNMPDYYGIHIDIDPVDVIPADKKLQQRLLAKLKRAHFVVRMKDLHPQTVHGVKRLARQIVQLLFAPISSQKAIERLHKIAASYRHIPEEQREYASCVMDPGNIAFFPYSVTKEYATYTYENNQYQGFKDYDSFLNALYGDYMTPPPKDKQVRLEHKWVHYYIKDNCDEESIKS